jgi:hypothetical protein
MGTNQHLQQILNTEVTRKQFLIHIGVLILTVMGIARVLQVFSYGQHSQPEPQGWGKSGYGGSH